jgi:hypothetical protein
MKPILLLTIGIVIMTCDKSSVVVQRWQVKLGRDTTTWSNSFFCQKSDFQRIDTVSELFLKQPDNSYSLKGTIKVLSRVPYDTLFIRNYLEYLSLVN